MEGSQILAERFDGAMEDVFTLQDDIAAAVGGRIAPSIEAADIPAHTRPTPDLTADDLYLRPSAGNAISTSKPCSTQIEPEASPLP